MSRPRVHATMRLRRIASRWARLYHRVNVGLITFPLEMPAMPRACAICGKTAAYGYKVSDSKVHTHRRFDANRHPAMINGVRLLVWTRCRRTQTRDERVAEERAAARRQ